MSIQKYLPTLALAFALSAIAWPLEKVVAADTTTVDPTGTWKVKTTTGTAKSTPGSGRTLKLKWADGKLSGALTKVSMVNGKSIAKERPIQEGKLHGNDISFSVTFPVEAGEGPDVTTKYQGEISGDFIKGTLEAEWMGNTIKRDWEAKRSKE